MTLTRAQRVALKSVFDRTPLYHSREGGFTSQLALALNKESISYRTFRRFVYPGHDFVMIHWCGMWLGIEEDGYTHS